MKGKLRLPWVQSQMGDDVFMFWRERNRRLVAIGLLMAALDSPCRDSRLDISIVMDDT